MPLKSNVFTVADLEEHIMRNYTYEMNTIFCVHFSGSPCWYAGTYGYYCHFPFNMNTFFTL